MGLTDRNLMSHTYDFAVFDRVASNIHARYVRLFDDVYDRLIEGEGEHCASSRPPTHIVLGAELRARLGVVFARFPDLESVTLIGSRALGSASPRSDIDLATRGIRDPRTLGRLILDLEDLDIPQTCDVKALEDIRYPPLERHIATAGVTIYNR